MESNNDSLTPVELNPVVVEALAPEKAILKAPKGTKGHAMIRMWRDPVWKAQMKEKMRQRWADAKQFRKTFKVDDLNNIRPLDLDRNGFPHRPAPVTKNRKKTMSAAERKVRFIRMYNWSGGVVSIACSDACILRTEYENWMREDELFRSRVIETHKEIADRMLLLMNMCMGLASKPHDLQINASMLKSAIKLRPDIYGDLDEPTDEPGNTAGIAHSIPRPAGQTPQPG